MKRRIACPIAQSLCAFLLLLEIAGFAWAQRVVSAKAGVIQFIEGKAFLDSKPIELSKGNLVQMKNNQTLRTEDGRVELLLSPNSFLRLDKNSSLRMEENRLQNACLSLQQGSAIVEIVEQISDSQITVRLPNGFAEMKKAGLYRFQAASSEIQVWGGELLAASRENRISIKEIRKAQLGKELKSTEFKADFLDKLHIWAALRSFALFDSDKDSRRQGHWRVTGNWGWMRNPYYRISCFSAGILAAQTGPPPGRTTEKTTRSATGASAAELARQQAIQWQQQQQPQQQPNQTGNTPAK
jgi:hypothetical protein